jgi:two-component system C4-dicarboxylate transport response regulator DctD
VLLDEIDSLPQAMQAKLLHAIQNRVIARLGSNERLELDVRFVATSKQDLVKEAEAGRFRADLLYRLNVVTLRIPPLRERREDVPNLFLQLVAEAAARYKREIAEVSGAVLSSIAAQEWPGNVRELRNAADRYVLGFDLALGRSFNEYLSPDRPGLAEQLADHEKALVAASLAANGGGSRTPTKVSESRARPSTRRCRNTACRGRTFSTMTEAGDARTLRWVEGDPSFGLSCYLIDPFLPELQKHRR